MVLPFRSSSFEPRRCHPGRAAKTTAGSRGRFRPLGDKNRAATGKRRCMIDVNSVYYALHKLTGSAKDMATDKAAAPKGGTGSLVPEMLTGHGLMMRLAAAADGFLGQAAADAAFAVPNLSLHAARTARPVAPPMDRHRNGVILLDRLSRADPA